ncbi:HBL043Wp [Eremothecium sinecaudum]|uniref:DNA replication regulator SLD2 n=1 Tax=Eremothecium sinecaudum TaxID=45286 RepID=A0A120K0Z6_9SACH|nr:HBL043Wp [Eremothecium sinecaudum]AMD18859.1 HBL043Wp [Eremothecium sinecaudum]
MDILDKLKIDLKLWERNFAELNGRSPGKDDIKNNPDIKIKYKTYASLKKNGVNVNYKDNASAREHFTPRRDIQSELGPTPQIYGTVLSLFEMSMSPEKQIGQFTSRVNEDTIESPINTLPVLSEKPVKRQLDFSMPTPHSPEKKIIDEAPVLEPANTDAKGTYGPNSPLKFDNDVALKLSKTPAKVAHHKIMGTSPSPLIKRPAKSLSQLAKEHETILQEMNSIGEQSISRNLGFVLQQELAEKNEEDENNPTVKVSKRRRKNKVGVALETIKEAPKGSVHDELAKLKRKAVNQFMGFEDNEDDSFEDNKAQPKEASKVKKRKNRKYKVVSDNFVRLKLPKKNRGGPRWRRR